MMEGRWPYWRCRDCDTSDGPVSNGDCDVCFDERGSSNQVVGLVPCDDAAFERAYEDLFTSGILDEIAMAEGKGRLDDRDCMADVIAIVRLVFQAAGRDGA